MSEPMGDVPHLNYRTKNLIINNNINTGLKSQRQDMGEDKDLGFLTDLSRKSEQGEAIRPGIPALWMTVRLLGGNLRLGVFHPRTPYKS